jgi:hypothetical protein
MVRIFCISSWVSAFLVLRCVVIASPPIIPYHEVTDTALYLRTAAQTRVSGLIHNWTAKGLNQCYAMSRQISKDEPGKRILRDTTVYLSLRYALPKPYSPREVQYTAIITFHFRNSSCINDDSLYDFCSTLASRIRSVESTKGVSLFLENTQADSGRVVCWYQSSSFEWYCLFRRIRRSVPREVASLFRTIAPPYSR